MENQKQSLKLQKLGILQKRNEGFGDNPTEDIGILREYFETIE